MIDLSKVPDADLIAELDRRLNTIDREPVTPSFCHECRFFVPFHGDEMPDPRVLCAHRHRPKFLDPEPDDYLGDTGGYCRSNCEDFAPATLPDSPKAPIGAFGSQTENTPEKLKIWKHLNDPSK